jgi:hypothetical protein
MIVFSPNTIFYVLLTARYQAIEINLLRLYLVRTLTILHFFYSNSRNSLNDLSVSQ